jgi:putative tryptophan/tyrosine transport system substrate-binding protein
MRRREFMAHVGGAAFAWPLAARAQQMTIPVIGFLSPGSPEFDAIRITALRRGLNEAGYIEGRDVTIEYRWARNQLDRMPVLAADLVEHPVAVIVAPGLVSTLAAKSVTSTVPIVFLFGVDPVDLGLVASLRRPGGNITGLNVFSTELAAKGLELLRELLPATASVGFLANSKNNATEVEARSVLAANQTIGVEIQILHASTEAEIDAAFAKLARTRAGALIVSADYFFSSRISQLVALSARYAIPTLYSIREFPVAGGLMSYGYNLTEGYRLIGIQVAQILKGEKPADLPVMQLSKIEFVINVKTATALGITIPQSLLARADEVIE